MPELRALLPAWRYFPLLGCIDCCVWMGRHDYLIDPTERRAELRSVAISVHEYGTENSSLEPLPAQPARLQRPARRGSNRDEDAPQEPQVGGVPSWTQAAVRVFCPSCRAEMVFIAAMGSVWGFAVDIPINNESGFQHHFACAGCRTLSVIAQWT